MRATWTGAISFGLVNVPVKLYSATEDHSLKAHQVHAADGGRIKYAKVCADCGEVVPSGDIAKQYEAEGHSVILTEDDLASIAEEANRQIDVLEFVPAGSIDTLMIDSAYYLGPDKSDKGYALLARTISDAGLVAIVKFHMRGKTRLAALGVTGKDILTLHTLRWADEVRQPDITVTAPVGEAELKAASALVADMAVETFNPDKYRDDYREELRELIVSRAEESPDSVPEVSDLLAKLEASAAKRQCKPDIRTWAKAKGLKVGARGRIPQDIVDQYEAVTA